MLRKLHGWSAPSVWKRALRKTIGGRHTYAVPLAFLIFRAFMASLPSEIDEAAIMDGASPLRVVLLHHSAVITTGDYHSDCHIGSQHL
jgi:ABC-type Fe3+ transport system permease subunit